MVDIELLSRDELLALYGRISVALDAIESRRAAAADAIRARNRDAQTQVPTAEDKTTEVRRARYYNPANRAVTWSGRGRCPNWFKVAMSEGRTPEELAKR